MHCNITVLVIVNIITVVKLCTILSIIMETLMLKSHWLVFISCLWKTMCFSLHHMMQHIADDYFVVSAILTNNEQCKRV